MRHRLLVTCRMQVAVEKYIFMYGTSLASIGPNFRISRQKLIFTLASPKITQKSGQLLYSIFKAAVQIGTQLFFARNRFRSLYYDVLKAFRPKFAKFHRQIFISIFQWEMVSHNGTRFTQRTQVEFSNGSFSAQELARNPIFCTRLRFLIVLRPRNRFSVSRKYIPLFWPIFRFSLIK
jgi:hypothetical protein